METSEAKKVTKPAAKKSTTSVIRVIQETRKRLLAELVKINKKSHGKRVRMDALLAKLLPKLTTQDVVELQEESLSGHDRMEQSYRAYCAKHGQITMDEFLNQLSKQALSQIFIQNIAKNKPDVSV